MKRRLEQAFFVIGTFLTCLGCLSLSAFPAHATIEKLLSAPHLEVKIETRALAPSVQSLEALCLDPASSAVATMDETNVRNEAAFRALDFESSAQLAEKLDGVFAGPVALEGERCQDELEIMPDSLKAVQSLAALGLNSH